MTKESHSDRNIFTFANGFSVEWNGAGLAMIVNAERSFFVAIPPAEFKAFIVKAAKTMKESR